MDSSVNFQQGFFASASFSSQFPCIKQPLAINFHSSLRLCPSITDIFRYSFERPQKSGYGPVENISVLHSVASFVHFCCLPYVCIIHRAHIWMNDWLLQTASHHCAEPPIIILCVCSFSSSSFAIHSSLWRARQIGNDVGIKTKKKEVNWICPIDDGRTRSAFISFVIMLEIED